MRSGEIGGTSRWSSDGLGRPLALGVLVTMLMVLGASAARADCPPTDPSCATGVADDAQQKVNDGAADPNGTADDAVRQAQDTAGGAVGRVTDTVDGILNPPGDEGGGPGGGGGGNHDGDGNQGGNGGNGTPAGTTGVAGGPTTMAVPTLLPTALTGATVDGQAPTGGRRGGHGVLGHFGDVIASAARQVAFPFALTLIVVTFLLIQNRLDRRDPKLAFAPIGPDVLPFD
jgi:hypothetical protein